MKTSSNYRIAKLGKNVLKYSAIPALLSAGYMAYSSDLRTEQNHLQARYGFRLDESKIK